LINFFARYIKIGFWSDSSSALSLRSIKSSSSKLLGLGAEKVPWKRTAHIAATNSICLCVRYIITNRFRRNPITISRQSINTVHFQVYIFKFTKINWITLFVSLPEFGNAFWKLKKRRLGEWITGWWAVDEARQTAYLTFIIRCSFYTICESYDCLFQCQMNVHLTAVVF
jgi:hypothetical protein